jgi:class 3 adenylate cyclase/DNA-binding winged helix-turn-helix (wHTH) protein/predicted ATPase
MRYHFEDCVLDTSLHRLERHGQPVRLQPRVFQLLVYLLEQRHRAVPRQELFEQVWPNQFVSDAALESGIKQVRQAIGDSGRAQRLLQTLHGHGYRFVAPIREAAEADVETGPPEALFRRPEALQESPPALCAGRSQAAMASDAAGPARPQAPAPPGPEHRQLTVLSCTLAEAATWTARLDPEQLHDVVRAFHGLGTAVIQQYEGYIAQRVAHGFLVYFGYPQAHDDDARRAVLAGLRLAEAIGSRRTPGLLMPELPLTVRLGIHTGPAVVGAVNEATAPTVLAVGPTVALATALQERATPQTVAISAATAALVRGYVTWQALPPLPLPGHTEPLAVYRVTGESGAQIRLDLALPQRLTPFVGREPELRLLKARWAQAQKGQGQAVLLGGEPGIGKSRLVRRLAERLPGTECTLLEGRGSPYHQHTAFYPLHQILRQVFRLDDAMAAEASVMQAEAMLRQYGLDTQVHLPLLSPLLDLSLPAECYPPLSLTPQHQRQRTFEALVALVLTLAAARPVLLTVEDLHWVDPSTLEWLGLLLDQVPTSRLLLLLTFRPECQNPWTVRSYLTQLTLDRLTMPQSTRMVEQVARGTLLPTPIVRQQIADQSDGVPLFIEELTQAVLKSDSTTTIPATLQEVLLARLDQVGVAKRTAQLGAVLGRQFGEPLLRAVSPLDAAALQQDLRQLVTSELLYQQGIGHEATYRFKHALIQETAYQSLRKHTRQQMHQQTARMLEAQFSAIAETQPEILAYHYTQARLYPRAIGYWQQAGQCELNRSAHMEAASHFAKALELLGACPESPKRDRHELALLLDLRRALVAARGYSAPEVGHALNRARELCQQLEDHSRLFQVLRSLGAFYGQRGELRTSQALSDEALALAQHLHDPVRRIQALVQRGSVQYWRGELLGAREDFEQCVGLYEPEQHCAHLASFGQDVGLTFRSYMAMVLWLLGYPDQALAWGREVLSLARTRSHPLTLAHTHGSQVVLYQYLRDAHKVQEHAEAAMALSAEHGFPFWESVGMVMRGWALVAQGQAEAGIAQLTRGLAAYRATGQEIFLPYYHAMLAEIYGHIGQPGAGFDLLAEAQAMMDQSGEYRWKAELYRLQGELLLLQTMHEAKRAEACFHQALVSAHQQRARSWELRAATSLARLWQSQGKCQAAYDLLAPVYNWFTEGFETADLQKAKTMLDNLRK